jgi:peptidoglycan-associated lipoprotein
MKIQGLIVPALAASILLGACKKDPPPPPAPTGPTAAELAQIRQDSIDAANEARRAREAAEAEAARRAEAARQAQMREARSTIEEMVFFDYDMAEITADAEASLRSKLPILRNSPHLMIRMEGHADERGSNEYNVALGSRRAEAVRQWLSDSGISGDRFTTTSYGEDRPLVNRSDEEAWARNRRVEFVITGGDIVVSDDRDRP